MVSKHRLLPLTALLGAGVLALAACGGGSTGAAASGSDSGSSAGGSAAFPAKGSGELNLYNWTDYISPDLLKRFESETGIKVHLDTFESNEGLLAKLQAGGTGYDVIVPSDYMVQQMVQLGLLQEIDTDTFPNGKNIQPEFKDVYFDQGRKFTAPYMHGTTGIAVDEAKVGGKVTSWAEFFNPPAGASGNMGILNDSNEVVAAALRAVGAKPCSETPADYQKVQALLSGVKGKLKVISSDGQIDRMTSGETTLAMMWNGAFHRASVKNKGITWVYPSEGLPLWQDNFAVPKGARNVDNAKIFINWMLDPKNAAEATNFVGYANAVTGSDAYMDKDLAKDPAITPPADKAALAQPVPPCSQTALDLYDKVWTDFKS
ncbi:extracellular solute-binding protein [Microbispora siamensis]|uniref:ABC transporter n=1 Tax=Microbispora siamensis TaxID=564413 RepID=A0ABQ4GNG1_9ACTN|nr:extracellular solute-binding protein [Microbispora siamensis]GIH62956.1 ABC transporter [Microbispora siamensis]